jgi:UTP--glucose-1-phosphate uridylyltransferase
VKQLADVYAEFRACVIALMEVPAEAVSSYGVVAGEPVAGRPDLVRITELVEKPKLADAPSRLAIVGRYVLVPEIYASLAAIPPGAGGEIQLTDGLRHLLRSQPIYGWKFEGRRYDAGDKLGFLKATVELAVEHPELGGAFRQYLKEHAQSLK